MAPTLTIAAAFLADVAAIFGIAALCGAWVVIQHWIARQDPCQPGVEGNCGCKGWNPDGATTCKRKVAEPDPAGEGTLVQFPTRH